MSLFALVLRYGLICSLISGTGLAHAANTDAVASEALKRAFDPAINMPLWPLPSSDIQTYPLPGAEELPLHAERIAPQGLLASQVTDTPSVIGSASAATGETRPGKVPAKLVQVQVPAYAQLRFRQAQQALQQGDLTTAEQHLIAAQRLTANWWPIYDVLGQLALRRSQPEMARQFWQRARLLAPDRRTITQIDRQLASLATGMTRINP